MELGSGCESHNPILKFNNLLQQLEEHRENLLFSTYCDYGLTVKCPTWACVFEQLSPADLLFWEVVEPLAGGP